MLASRYHQPLSGHAATGAFLHERLRKTPSNACWRCSSNERQSRHHPFARRKVRAAQRKELWRSVGKACGWKNPWAPSIRTLFKEEKETSAELIPERNPGWPVRIPVGPGRGFCSYAFSYLYPVTCGPKAMAAFRSSDGWLFT